jgi:hypothetical protein
MTSFAPGFFEIEIWHTVQPDGVLYDTGDLAVVGPGWAAANWSAGAGTGLHWQERRQEILNPEQFGAIAYFKEYLADRQPVFMSLLARVVCELERLAGLHRAEKVSSSQKLGLSWQLEADGTLTITRGIFFVTRFDGESALLIGWLADRDHDAQIKGRFFDEPASIEGRDFYENSREALQPMIAAGLNAAFDIWTPELSPVRR